MARTKQAERAAEIAKEQEAMAHATSPDVVNMRGTIDGLLAAAEQDPNATPAKIEAIKRVKAMADAPNAEPLAIYSATRHRAGVKPTKPANTRGTTEPVAHMLGTATKHTTGPDGVSDGR